MELQKSARGGFSSVLASIIHLIHGLSVEESLWTSHSSP